jgi:hypothetical protein
MAKGFCPKRSAKHAIRSKAKALYCTPTIQNPTAATMSKARRLEVAAIARRYGLPIFRGRHLWSAAAAGTGSTCGDPSRTHLLHRQPGEMSAARVAHRLLCRTRFGKRRPSRRGNPRNLSDGATFDEQPRKPWICDGSSEEILRAIRQEATIRQRLARDLLSNLEFAAHPEGHHIWLTLPSDWHRAEFGGYVRPRGLAAVASEAFAISTDRPNAVRISLGAAGDADQLRQALKLVTDTLAQSPSVLSTVI